MFMLLAMAGLFIFHTETIIYICIAMIVPGNDITQQRIQGRL